MVAALSPVDAAVNAAATFIRLGGGSQAARHAGLALVTSIHPIMTGVFAAVSLIDRFIPAGHQSDTYRYRLVNQGGLDPVKVAAIELWMQSADVSRAQRAEFWAKVHHEVLIEQQGGRFDRFVKCLMPGKDLATLRRNYLGCNDVDIETEKQRPTKPKKTNFFDRFASFKRKPDRPCNCPPWRGVDYGMFSIALVDLYADDARAATGAASRVWFSLTGERHNFTMPQTRGLRVAIERELS